VKVRRNHLELRDAHSGDSLSESVSPPFTTNRLLVGDFVSASKALERLVKKLYGNPMLSPKPLMVMHPLEMTEGGLCGVELRAFYELADTAGSAHTAIHVGPELSDAEVIALTRKRSS
jgi:rod shape-determining protein MreB